MDILLVVTRRSPRRRPSARLVAVGPCRRAIAAPAAGRPPARPVDAAGSPPSSSARPCEQAFRDAVERPPAAVDRRSRGCDAPAHRASRGSRSAPRWLAGQADLTAKKDVIGTQLDQIKGEMRSELDRLGQAVASLSEQQRPALRAGRPVAARRTPRSPSTCRRRRRACARRSPTRRPAASGASGWPRTCCASPASSRTSTTSSRPPSRATAGRCPTSRS